MENEEKRMLGDYEVKQSIHIGKKEVVFGVNEADKFPFMVCYCTYDNPLSAAWPTEGIGTDDYLEAMQIFTDRVQAQIEVVKDEQSRFDFDMTPFTKDDCIPDNRNESIVGKVVVINAELNRYEYQHSAYQLVLVDGGHGAIGGRGQAVFGTCLADGKRARWEGLPKRKPALFVGRVSTQERDTGQQSADCSDHIFEGQSAYQDHHFAFGQ